MKNKALILIGLIFMCGCMETKNIENSSTTSTTIQTVQPTTSSVETSLEQTYSSYMLTLIFNEKTLGDIVAVTSYNRTKENPGGIVNTEFREYFSEDMEKFTAQYDEIADINVRNWFGTIDAVVINVNYSTTYMSTNELKSIVSSLWYVKNIEEDKPGVRY